ncbi:MAG: adenosine deaminase family protein [Candidatus Tectomicrobia bacterium]|uniref:adenosine deaminase n=1 Tax=Tectimicrobiota bacterium TaxID=2528274 RepID=A0A932FW80_UNCTE|nr:adenosine deaminase family protein [Candidatus Tectomicrobia bacterium]
MARYSLEEVRDLPKAVLHLHLDGSLRSGTFLELWGGLPAATRSGLLQALELKPKDDRQLLSSICGSKVKELAPGNPLGEYLKAFALTCAVMKTAPALERIAYEAALDAHLDGAVYLEVRFAPFLHYVPGVLDYETIVEQVILGLRRAESETGMPAGVIICGLRNYVPVAATQELERLMACPISPSQDRSRRRFAAKFFMMEMAKLTEALSHQYPEVVGFDIAGDESGHPISDYTEAFFTVINNYIPVTAHAGEGFNVRSIEQAILFAHATRIGHGIRLLDMDDPELKELHPDPDRCRRYIDRVLRSVVHSKIVFEICPTSNLQIVTGVDRYQDHPIEAMRERGVRVSVNPDNTLISDTTASKDLQIVANTFDWSEEVLMRVCRNSFSRVFYNNHSCAVEYNERKRQHLKAAEGRLRTQ